MENAVIKRNIQKTKGEKGKKYDSRNRKLPPNE